MKAEEFTLKKEIDLCTAWIAHDIRSPRRRKQVREEYAAHLDDAGRCGKQNKFYSTQ